MVKYQFQALTKGFDLIRVAEVTPGKTDLYHFIRFFGGEAGIGRYRHLDHDIESPTFCHHLFERGMVKIHNIHK